MDKLELIDKSFRKADALTTSTTLTCECTFSQRSKYREPHRLYDVAWLYFNDQEVGKIFFKDDPDEVKSKTITVELSANRLPPLNVLKFKTLVDNEYINGCSSTARFVLKVGGKTRINETYKASLPLRHIEDRWIFANLDELG